MPKSWWYSPSSPSSRPILRLQKDTEVIAAGNLDHEVAADANDEIGRFSRAFSFMTRRLKEKIAERRRTEEALARLVKDLEATNRELNEFAHVVSHDLKAPLRAIASLTSVIVHDFGGNLDGEGRLQADLLLSRVTRMNNLIEGILQYSRIGRVREEHVDVDLNEILAQAVDLISPPPHVRVVVENRLPVIRCDRTRMQQIFQNLVGNAVKFMDKPEGRVRVGCAEVDGCWQFHVADNGPGIDPQYFDRIFKIFQTLKSRDEFESTGIGLAIVKKIVDGHGGRVWVESTVGQGSKFFFTLKKEGMPA